MRDSGFGSFLAGVLIGGLVGIAVGLLLAPSSGEELREQVGGYVDERRAAFDDAVNEGRLAAEQARADLQDAYDAGEGGDTAEAEAAG
jgi:gas vesicle protein